MSWTQGPVGPGFFLLFSSYLPEEEEEVEESVVIDGGPMFDRLGKKRQSDNKDRQIDETIALLLLLEEE